MKQLLLKSCLIFLAAAQVCCEKNDPPPESENCDPAHLNDTLTLLYPCDGQTDVRGDSFVWEATIPMQGVFELFVHISPNFENTSAIYSNHNWLFSDQTVRKYVHDNLPLRPHTRYYWYMRRRHDGNGLMFTTPVQSFVTGDTPFALPTVFQNKFAGKFTVQDTLVNQSCDYINGPSNPCVSNYMETLQGAKTFQLIHQPDQPIHHFASDTVTKMLLQGPRGEYLVSINTKGEFNWSNGTYYTFHRVNGRVSGDNIHLTDLSGSTQAYVYSGSKYGGVRTQ
jgi:hypothetical protein